MRVADPRIGLGAEVDAQGSDAGLSARAREAADIAQARAQIAAGLYVDAAEMSTWMESIGTEHELPPPVTRTR